MPRYATNNERVALRPDADAHPARAPGPPQRRRAGRADRSRRPAVRADPQARGTVRRRAPAGHRRPGRRSPCPTARAPARPRKATLFPFTMDGQRLGVRLQPPHAGRAHRPNCWPRWATTTPPSRRCARRARWPERDRLAHRTRHDHHDDNRNHSDTNLQPNALDTRRQALAGPGRLAAPVCPALAQAQSDKPVRFILPVSAGSGVDTITRAASSRARQGAGPAAWWWTTSPAPAAWWACRPGEGGARRANAGRGVEQPRDLPAACSSRCPSTPWPTSRRSP